jgi:hypothetical protein
MHYWHTVRWHTYVVSNEKTKPEHLKKHKEEHEGDDRRQGDRTPTGQIII